MSQLLFDNSERMPEGDYLKLMNSSKDIFKMAERMDRQLMLRAPVPAARAPVAPVRFGDRFPPARAPREVVDQLIRLAGESEAILRRDLSWRRKADMLPICRTMGLQYSNVSRASLLDNMVNWLNAQPTEGLAAEA